VVTGVQTCALPISKAAGLKLIQAELEKIKDEKIKQEVKERIKKISQTNQRDMYF
jgi:putative component of toxin-antitoxin plasmid stabilization module